MKYLLDTHVVIWYFEDSSELSSQIIEIIDSSENIKYISYISLWEIAIKMNLKKLDLKLTLSELLNKIQNSEFNILQIEDEHLSNC